MLEKTDGTPLYKALDEYLFKIFTRNIEERQIAEKIADIVKSRTSVHVCLSKPQYWELEADMSVAVNNILKHPAVNAFEASVNAVELISGKKGAREALTGNIKDLILHTVSTREGARANRIEEATQRLIKKAPKEGDLKCDNCNKSERFCNKRKDKNKKFEETTS